MCPTILSTTSAGPSLIKSSCCLSLCRIICSCEIHQIRWNEGKMHRNTGNVGKNIVDIGQIIKQKAGGERGCLHFTPENKNAYHNEKSVQYVSLVQQHHSSFRILKPERFLSFFYWRKCERKQQHKLVQYHEQWTFYRNVRHYRSPMGATKSSVFASKHSLRQSY